MSATEYVLKNDLTWQHLCFPNSWNHLHIELSSLSQNCVQRSLSSCGSFCDDVLKKKSSVPLIFCFFWGGVINFISKSAEWWNVMKEPGQHFKNHKWMLHSSFFSVKCKADWMRGMSHFEIFNLNSNQPDLVPPHPWFRSKFKGKAQRCWTWNQPAVSSTWPYDL